MEQRLLVLGAGRHQKALIRRAEERGLRVVASDYYPDAPGKALASHPVDVDATAIEENITLARRYAVRGVITSGTDLALVAMAEVARALGLPCYLTPEAARTATNKARMAAAFSEHGVPHAPWRELRDARDAPPFRLPAVVKPADSQGQRGVSRVSRAEDWTGALGSALAASRTASAIVEPFMEGFEVTASAWAKPGGVRIQMITDRVTYNPLPAIGICFQHVYPSLHAAGLAERVRQALGGVVAAYGVRDAPLYVQMIVRDGALSVVEAACRVGGGHEASLMPVATGVEVLDRLIDLALEGRSAPIEDAHDERGARGHALVNFLLPRPGAAARLAGMENNPLIVEGEYYIRPGHECREVVDGQGRIGYFIAREATRVRLLANAEQAYRSLTVADAAGRNLLFIPERKELLG
jgi:biotin carboxylase